MFVEIYKFIYKFNCFIKNNFYMNLTILSIFESDIVNNILSDLSYNDICKVKICCRSLCYLINSNKVKLFFKNLTKLEYKPNADYLKFYKALQIDRNVNEILKHVSLCGDIKVYNIIMDLKLVTHKPTLRICEILVYCARNKVKELHQILGQTIHCNLSIEEIPLLKKTLTLNNRNYYDCIMAMLMFHQTRNFILKYIDIQFDKIIIVDNPYTSKKMYNKKFKSLYLRLIPFLQHPNIIRIPLKFRRSIRIVTALFKNPKFHPENHYYLVDDACKNSNRTCLKIMLQDPRLVLNQNIVLSKESMKILIKDYRVNVENLKHPSLQDSINKEKKRRKT